MTTMRANLGVGHLWPKIDTLDSSLRSAIESITMHESDADRATRVLKHEFKEESVQVTARQRVSAVSIISGKKLDSALSGRFLAALGKAEIEALCDRSANREWRQRL